MAAVAKQFRFWEKILDFFCYRFSTHWFYMDVKISDFQFKQTATYVGVGYILEHIPVVDNFAWEGLVMDNAAVVAYLLFS